MKTRPTRKTQKLEDGIPRVKKIIRNIINLNELTKE